MKALPLHKIPPTPLLYGLGQHMTGTNKSFSPFVKRLDLSSPKVGIESLSD